MQQLDRLDPAQKAMSVVGFKNSSATERTILIEKFIHEHFSSEEGRVSIEHISKGPANNRTLTGVSVIEFGSKFVRNNALAKIKARNLQIQESDGNILRIDYAKSKRQISRNAFVHKAFDMIKADEKSRGKPLEKEWKVGSEAKSDCCWPDCILAE